MEMIRLLLGESRRKVLLCGLFSLGAGAANGGVMIIISEVIAANFLYPGQYVGAFFFLVILGQAMRYVSNVTITTLVETITVRMRLIILDALRACPLEQFEQISPSRIHNVLTSDCQAISRFIPDMIELLTAGVTLLFCMGYLAWLSPMIFFLALVVMAMAVGLYFLRQHSAKTDLEASRSQLERTYQLILDFMDGFKELKLNPVKSADLFDNHIEPGFHRTRDLLIKAARIIQLNSSLGLGMFFSLMGFVLFYLPRHFPGNEAVISKIIIVLLYMVPPGGQFLYSALQFARLDVAVKNLEGLKTRALAIKDRVLPLETGRPGTLFHNFNRIRLQEISFSYPDKDHHPGFCVGPLSMDIERGSTVFITGGNGSGKTTLSKLITGLYFPEKGTFQVDRTDVGPENLNAYRSLFSSVFSDFYLFEALYGIHDPDKALMKKWLDRFSLSSKLSITGNRFSTSRLSAGQRRRLALFCAVMDDKPILICDEMTADQEPGFREYFYKTFIPEMKKEGKTLIVITHDDRYFHLADQMIKLEYGSFITGRRP